MGVIKYYRNTGARSSHILAPLTIIAYNKRKLKWTQVKQDALEKNKEILVRDTLLTYPDFN